MVFAFLTRDPGRYPRGRGRAPCRRFKAFEDRIDHALLTTGRGHFMHRRRTVSRVLLAAQVAMASATPLLAQGSEPQRQPHQQREQSWSVEVRAGALVRYDDNLFLLAPDQKVQLETLSAGNAQSGRFANMKDARDVIPTVGLSAALEGPGFFGRTLTLEAGASYQANLQNIERRHAELALSAAHGLGRGGRLRLAAGFRPGYFHKNYLADATDANGDGRIARAERSYRAGRSNEFDLTLGYRHRLVRATKERRVSVSAEIKGGLFDRSYDAPFAGRSRRGPGAELGLTVELGGRWTFGGEYSYERLAADVVREVMILDETSFGRDFNGNGVSSDVDARAFELVDRSRREKGFGVTVRGELTRSINAELAYAHRGRDFSSSQPFDVSNLDRRDGLDEFAGALDVRLARRLRLALGARYASQETNRQGDPGSIGEVADYQRTVAWAGLRYRF